MPKQGERDLPIRCSCGVVRGKARGLSAENGNRCVCYCDDCQSFTHFLGRAGEILDPHGGTEIFQMSAHRLDLSDGLDRLACMRLGPTGMLRWYASCCATPIGNTLPDSRRAFVGLILACLDESAGAPTRDEVLGPIQMRVYARFAQGDFGGIEADDGMPEAMRRRVGQILSQTGPLGRSPFFDVRTGEPTAIPRMLSETEREEIERIGDEIRSGDR